ncbi:hypothetical protein BH23GEM11_BH23GEM11_03280 [soil metagenome]
MSLKLTPARLVRHCCGGSATATAPSRPLSPPLVLVLALMVGIGSSVRPAAAQVAVPDRGEVRLGMSLGGTGLVGLIAEYRRGDWSGELTVGTITFREVSVSVAGKRYFGDGRFQPVIGAGLWSLTAWTEDGSGSVLIARVPLAVDWRVAGGNALGLEVALNRGLAVNRLDPEDDTPTNTTIVPLPGLYYRYGWQP